MTNYAHTREAVRVKVKKCELNIPPEWRKFSVDPQITSLEVLYSLLAKAFDIKSDFSIKYKAFDPAGNEIYLAVLSDWDLDAAFLRIHNLSIQTATEPCLILQIDIKPFTEVKEWDVETASSAPSSSVASVLPSGNSREMMSPLQQSLGVSQKYVQHMQTKLPGLIMNQMEKTFSIVQKAFNLSEETMATLPPRAPLSDNEFRLFLDAVGQIQRSDELRKVIFFGGIDPSLRRVVWKHILNVYPSGMNGHQRMDYMRRKSEYYYKLRDTWKAAIKQGCVVGELSYVTSMVKKDVLRTDRLHSFYAGSDDNQNIASLFNILTTYALNHPSVSYCQGMSDIASPLLVTMNDEAQAYICFCAIMSRVRGNFMLDGIAMTQKFSHLTEALSFYDPEFWEYLKAQQADDLLFCYRWLLLELKREFPFEDALRMLEVQWSSLKYETNAGKELCLYEKEFVPILETSAPTTSSSISGSMGAPPTSPSYLLAKPRENPYTKVCALRRQSSSASLSSLSSSLGTSTNALNCTKLDSSKRLNQSLDDNMSRHVMRRQRHASATKAHQSLDETKMLMLMEGIENVRDHDDSAPQTPLDLSVAEDIDDDDVFATTTPTSINTSHNESSQFNFHPTNPFIEAAAQFHTKQVPTHVGDSSQHSTLNEDNCAQSLASDTSPIPAGNDLKDKSSQIPKGIAKLHNSKLSNYNAVSNIITKQIANASNVGESMKRVGSGTGGHFKDLKDKIAATSRKGISFDDPNNTSNEKSQQKLVKNFNEFLNFASINKNRIADRFATSTSVNMNQSNTTSPTHTQTQLSTATPPPPLVQLTKSDFAASLDESDSSSVPETTWSGSTAATAIQQTSNVSNTSNSLHLELTSPLSSATYTPPGGGGDDNTPTREYIAGESKESVTSLPLKILQTDLSLTPDDSHGDQEYYPMKTAITRELRLEAENLDRHVYGDPVVVRPPLASCCDIEYEKLDKDSLDLVEDLKENEIISCPDVSELLVRRRNRDAKAKSSIERTTPNRLEFDSPWGAANSNVSNNIEQIDGNLNVDAVEPTLTAAMTSSLDALKLNPFIDARLINESSSISNSSSLPEVIVPISTGISDASPIEMATNASDEIAFAKSPQKIDVNGSGVYGSPITALPTATIAPMPASASAPMLPPPTEFGGGNPFLMFLCLTLLLQHRNTVMKSGMDYNEIAMHFDKMVRKHDVTRVLNQARRMYIDYLKVQNSYNQQRLQASATMSDINKNPNVNAPTQQQQHLQSYASTTANS